MEKEEVKPFPIQTLNPKEAKPSPIQTLNPKKDDVDHKILGQPNQQDINHRYHTISAIMTPRFKKTLDTSFKSST